jgi:preprotein translocase subunit SecF
MQFLVNTSFDFMGKRKFALVLSTVLILIAIGSLISHGGPKYSVDFTGGSFVEVRFDQPIDIGQLRAALLDLDLASTQIQRVGRTTDNDYIIRLSGEEVSAKTQELLGEEMANPFGLVKHATAERMPGVEATLRRQETVGPKIGSELRGQATKAVLVAVLLMLIYIALRFPGIAYAMAAAVALFHDLIITLGVFSLLDREISLTVLAAFLTIAGYSINDTIVVYDRIREELKARRRDALRDVINHAVNLTLSRTLLTGVTTLIALIALYVLGGTVIHEFAFAMVIGVIIGTYSSIFVASALVLAWESWRQSREPGRRTARKQRPASAKTA